MGGSARVLKFGTNATALFCQHHGVSLSDMAKMFQPETINPMHYRDLIWAALVSGGSECTPEQVGDWIDEMEQSEFNRIFASFESAPEGKTGRKS